MCIERPSCGEDVRPKPVKVLEFAGQLPRPNHFSIHSLTLRHHDTMAPEADQLYSLSNPLVTVDQLSSSSSQLDGVPADLESSLRFAGAQLIQAAGILLRLPQETIAQAIVIFYRFYVGSEGGSFKINALKVFLIQSYIFTRES